MGGVPIIKLLQFLFLFYFCIGYTKGATPSYFFQQLNLDKGLSQTTVNCILADNKGLIWIRDGLAAVIELLVVVLTVMRHQKLLP